MELPDFLTSYADPGIRDQIPLVNYSASLVTDEEVAEIVDQGGRHSADHVASMVAMGDQLIAKAKEIQALGAFTKEDRSIAMDMLGFKKQLVFATHSVVTSFHPSSKTPDEVRYGLFRAHNRHLIDFCRDDDRLMGVAVVPLDNPALAIDELEFAIEAVWKPCGYRIRHPSASLLATWTSKDSGPVWPSRVPRSCFTSVARRCKRSGRGATTAELQ
ncbi:MAG: hypothetical protein R2706_05875 [Acidimicrobiales bacterium]